MFNNGSAWSSHVELYISMYKKVFVCIYISVYLCVRVFEQGILKGEASLYHWPPVWLVWNQLYDNWQLLLYLLNILIQTSQTGGQRYSDTSPRSIPLFGCLGVCVCVCMCVYIRNTNWGWRLNTVDLLIKVACLIKKGNIYFFKIKN